MCMADGYSAAVHSIVLAEHKCPAHMDAQRGRVITVFCFSRMVAGKEDFGEQRCVD